MRGEWNGKNDCSCSLRESFRSVFSLSTNRQARSGQVMILTWNALTNLNSLCFTAGYTLIDLVFPC